MCQAFSCVITKAGDCYWKAGKDSHEDIIDLYKKKDKLLDDSKLPTDFVRIEIIPENEDYLNPYGKWNFKLDDARPKWWNDKFKKICWVEHKKWVKKIYNSFNWQEAKNSINPFDIKPPKITNKHLKLLKQWASVRARASVWASVRDLVWDSVRASVGDSVRASVRVSVGDSVWDSVRVSVGDSVRASVWDSVGAYIGTFFPKIKKWQYCDFKYKGYPFQPAVDLWKMGLVPSYDGNIWRLHGGKDAKILWEGKI